MVGSMGAITAPSTESDLLALVRLLADPAATEARLHELHKAKAEVDAGQADLVAQKQHLAEATGELDSKAKKVASDQVELDKWRNSVHQREQAVIERERAVASESVAKKQQLDAREVAVSDREVAVAAKDKAADAKAAKASADAAAAATLRKDYEDRLAKIKSLAQ